MNTPDITPAQIIAGLTALLGAVVVLFKLQLSDEQRAAFITIIGTVVPLAWTIGDAIIRHGRSRALGSGTVDKTVKPTPAAKATPAKK